MSERKVLNKYYPPDYDPRRLPRKAGGGNIEDKIMVIRTMAPFHMRCITCGKSLNYKYASKFDSYRLRSRVRFFFQKIEFIYSKTSKIMFIYFCISTDFV